MPDKISKRSRNIGSPKPPQNQQKKRGRPPKNTKNDSPPPPPPETALAPSQTTSTLALPSQTTNQQTSTTSQSTAKPLKYTGIQQIEHGLSFSTFDPNSYFPSDVFNDTSALTTATKEDADKAVHSIEGKRQRMRIVLANQGLMQDIIKGGMEERKIEGLAIDYDALKINNETKFINWQVAGLNRDIASNKWEQTKEKLLQGEKTLAGMRTITPLIDEEWLARKALKQSSINDLKTKALRGSSAMDAKLQQVIDVISNNESDD